MIRLNKEIITVAGIFALISMSLILFLIYPQMRDIRAYAGQITASRERASYLYLQNDEIDRFENNYQRYESNLSIIDQLLVDRQNPVKFITFLETTSVNVGLDSEINLVRTQDQSLVNPNSIVFQIFSRGGMAKILSYARKLEYGPYLITIKRLTIEQSPDGTEGNFLIEAVTKN